MLGRGRNYIFAAPHAMIFPGLASPSRCLRSTCWATASAMRLIPRAGRGECHALLEVHDLVTEFPTRKGVVRAVNGVTFDLERGEILAVVGESGSGKSVTSLSIMGLLQEPGHVAEGSITFDGKDLLAASEEEMEQVRGGQISMIFQEPMTSLNPVYRVGDQIVEASRRTPT